MSKGWHDFWMYDYCRQRVASFQDGHTQRRVDDASRVELHTAAEVPHFQHHLARVSAEVQLAEAETRMSKLRQPWQKWRRHDARNFMHAWS